MPGLYGGENANLPGLGIGDPQCTAANPAAVSINKKRI